MLLIEKEIFYLSVKQDPWSKNENESSKDTRKYVFGIIFWTCVLRYLLGILLYGKTTSTRLKEYFLLWISLSIIPMSPIYMLTPTCSMESQNHDHVRRNRKIPKNPTRVESFFGTFFSQLTIPQFGNCFPTKGRRHLENNELVEIVKVKHYRREHEDVQE